MTKTHSSISYRTITLIGTKKKPVFHRPEYCFFGDATPCMLEADWLHVQEDAEEASEEEHDDGAAPSLFAFS